MNILNYWSDTREETGVSLTTWSYICYQQALTITTQAAHNVSIIESLYYSQVTDTQLQ